MTTDMHLALFVEDDPAVQKIVQLMLESNGFRVAIAESGGRAERDARTKRPDIVILDLGLPDLDGLELIKTIREWSPVPLLVLSARTAESQRLAAFEFGADDYVIKPFSAPELLARVRALLRRHARGQTASALLQLGELSIDRTAAHRAPTPWRGAAPDTLGAPYSRDIESLSRPRGDAVAAHARGLGPAPDGYALAARFHHHAAQEARGRPGAADAHFDRAWDRLPTGPGEGWAIGRWRLLIRTSPAVLRPR